VGKKSHILDFSSKQSAIDSQRGIRPLPVLVEEARNVCITELVKHLTRMFEQADDSLFDMSESGYNNAHFDAMRMLRLKKESLMRNFNQELKLCFSENLGKAESSSLEDEQYQTMSFENIALVEESDLEEGIAIDGMVKKARNNNVDALEKIRTRLDTLIANHTISKENNPFEPAFICSAFKKASLTLDIDIESMLVIYKLFERMVIAHLADIYARVNQFFVDKGVLPDLKVAPHQRRQEVSTQTAFQPQDSINELLDIKDSTAQSVDAAKSTTHGGDQIVTMMQSLLARGRSSASIPQVAQPIQTSNGIIQMDTAQLVSALTGLQHSPNVVNEGTANVVADLRNVLAAQLGASQPIQHGTLGQFNDDMIDIVSMLFDFILDDENVHLEIKSIIARLQIPMLKVGLVDRSFFSNKKHPARILLNEIARAGISWDPSDKDAEQMLQKIESICAEIIENFSDDISIFNILLTDFETFRSQIQRRADIFERRTREAEEGKAKAETARGKVNKQLEKICQGKHVPESVKEILKNVWLNVMFLERLKDDQENWEKVCKVAKLLVWSVQPIKNEEGLAQLKQRIPSIVKNLRRGFDIISLSPIDATRMLEALESTHRQLMKETQERLDSEKNEEILRLAPAPLMPDISITQDVEEKGDAEDTESIEIETIEIEDIGFSPEQTGTVEKESANTVAELTPESLQAVERLSAGHWVELEIDKQYTRCKLAAKISSTGKFIFVNRSGVKIAEFFTDALAAEYQLGRLKILDEEALFDRALESVISSLRAMKQD